MKIKGTVLLFTVTIPVASCLRQQMFRGLGANKQHHCGCLQCDETVWNKPAVDYSGSYTCGERIEYIRNKFDVTEEDACLLVAGKEFAAVCGIECNPNRCDSRNVPYDVVDDAPPASGDLKPDTPLYCYPPYEQRKRWSQVWDNDFILEAKQTPQFGRCGPGNSFFDANLLDFDAGTEELKLEFKKENGIWKGAEVRLILPEAEMPFTYGTFEWSVKSVKVFRGNQVVSRTIPPSIVLGLFTWDATENFDVRENFNHEVDIEISQFTDVGGPDVNLLVQPVGLPQHAKLHSGGLDGVYDQSGYNWKFDWNPNNVTWYSTAAGGLKHQYSANDILYYSSPPYVQCLPADVEVRINLWNVHGVDNPAQMTDDMRIEVIIDEFSYKKSGETHVPVGGPCTKHCQCGGDAFCNAGTCELLDSVASVTAAPSFSPVQVPTGISHPPMGATMVPTLGDNIISGPDERSCGAHPGCTSLSGMCCPTIDGVFLYCCD